MFTGRFIHCPGLAAASRHHAALGGSFAAGSRFVSCDDLRPHRGGSDVRREFWPWWKTSQDVFKVGHWDVHCVESAAPSRAPAAQVCPK